MKRLFDDPQDQEDVLRGFELREELSAVQEELELFSFTAWGMFVQRLEALVSKDLEALVNCPVEEVAPTRARIKAHRHLLGLEQELRGREADIRRALAGPEDEDDDGDDFA